MTQLFYTDLAKALYMADNFDVIYDVFDGDYIKGNYVGMIRRASIKHNMFNLELETDAYHYFIHEISHHIFEPRSNDIGLDAANRLCKFILKEWILLNKRGTPVYPVEIIMSDNKHFFMPEKEE